MKQYPRDKPRRRDPEQKRNDEIDARLVEAAAAAVVEQLKRTLENNPARAVRNLGPEEVKHVAIGCISAYVLKRAEIEKAEAEFNDPLVDLFA